MRISLLLAVLCVFSVKGQIVYDFDTLRYEDRMNSDIDSLDVSGSDFSTTFDGGRSILSPTGLSTGELFQAMISPALGRVTGWRVMRFSALPHLGFSYNIGGQASQFMNVDYNHAFSHRLVLDVSYKRSSGVGVIRNGDFKTNGVKLQLQRHAKRYSTTLKAGYQSSEAGHSGGVSQSVLADSSNYIDVYGLEYAGVIRGDARSNWRYGTAIWSNYFNFLNDSVNGLGLISRHEYRITNRLYTESGDLNALYDTVYIDSLSTRDIFNTARISNGAGMYYISRKLYVHGLLDYTYWKYSNLGQHTESGESDVHAVVRYSGKAFRIQDDLRFNIAGRFNELMNRMRFSYRKKDLSTSLSLGYSQLAPTVFQRKYSANNASYALSDIQTQNALRVRGGLGYVVLKDKIDLSAYADYSDVSNLYYFNDSTWVNDSVQNSFFSIGLRSRMKFGVFNFQPHIVYAQDQHGYLPNLQAYGRLFVRGRLFKAKLLEVVVGVDASYISEFKTKAYIPSMDTYDWQMETAQFDPMFNLHAFLSLGIKEFRFFFRYENIGYFWSSRQNQELYGYPIAQQRMRLGITWDFFN